MNFRRILSGVALSTFLVACGKTNESAPVQQTAGQAAPAVSTSASKPVAGFPVNVVWILLDACRPDHLSCYGYSRPTSPNIDAVAARGARFEQNFAQGPATLLSVESYMTGRYTPAQYQ